MMHSFYLRNMYQNNLLVQPGGITLKGVPIDLGQIKTPSYFLSTKEDHIAPWKADIHGQPLSRRPGALRARRLGPYRRRHQPAGLDQIRLLDQHPPARRCRRLAAIGASSNEGSWWPDWHAWLAKRSGKMVPARDPSAGPLPPLEDAPGRFVKLRAVD